MIIIPGIFFFFFIFGMNMNTLDSSLPTCLWQETHDRRNVLPYKLFYLWGITVTFFTGILMNFVSVGIEDTG